MAGQLWICGKVSDLFAHRNAIRAARHTEHFGPPSAGPVQPQQESHGRRLPRAVWAKQAENGTSRNYQVQIVNGHQSVGVDLRQVLNADGG